jgi:hypothetical protein
VRRDARPETRVLALVIALRDLRHFVQPRDDRRFPCGTRQLDKFADGTQLRAQFLDQLPGNPRPVCAEIATALEY